MNARANLTHVLATVSLLAALSPALAQERPAQRVANIVSVAIEEYTKGVDAKGRLTSNDEYEEAVGFLKDARDAALRLPGERSPAARAVLDSIIAAVAAKRPPAVLDTLNQHFAATLGSEAALPLPMK